MRIALFGLGYVGSVSAACLAAAGHDVVAVDVEALKLAMVRQGRSPVMETDLDEWLQKAVVGGRLRVSDDPVFAVQQSDLSLICVGTPSRRNGGLDTTFLERVVQQIGHALAGGTSFHVMGVRSTVLPGIVGSRLIPLLEACSARPVGSSLGVCVNPEFLREGSAIRDFQTPPFTVIGESHPAAGDVLQRAYAHLQAPVHRLPLDEACLIKYASNAFHAVKVAFANEIGALSQQLGVDGREVMRVFCEDRDLNLSARYLQPGFGFGGSCLPKDLRALNFVARDLDIATPLLNSVLGSNDAHIVRVVDAVLETGKRRVALLGLSFKNGSDDLRESPFVRLAEALIGRGLMLRVCDPDVAISQLIGRNRAFIEERLPHVAQLLSSEWETVTRDSDVVIVGKRLWDPARLAANLHEGQTVIDLVGIESLGPAVRPWAASSANGGRVESLVPPIGR